MQTLMCSLSDNQLIIPSQEQMAVAQQNLLQTTEEILDFPSYSSNQELEKKALTLTDLLKTNQQKALLTISELVSSAKKITSQLTHSLTSVPIHPYERLIYDYFGTNFKCLTIHDLIIPNNFNPIKCLKQTEQIANNVGQLIQTQFKILSTEVFDTSFYGITSENLNNAFVALSSTSKGEQYVIDDKKIKDHLQFIETVKNIPSEYVINNPILVAKKILAEFTRIHCIEKANDDQVISNSITDAIENSSEVFNKMLNDYDQMNSLQDINHEPISQVFKQIHRKPLAKSLSDPLN